MRYQFGIYIYICVYVYICIYVYTPPPKKGRNGWPQKKGSNFQKEVWIIFQLIFQVGVWLVLSRSTTKKWYRVVMMVLSCQVWWWQMPWVGSCGFFGGLEDQTSSPVIFQADVRFRLMKDGRGGYGGSKIPHVNDWWIDHLHGLFIYDCQYINRPAKFFFPPL